MACKMKYIGILLAVMSLTELQAQNDSVKIRSYGIANEYFINYLGFVKPNIAIVPAREVFMYLTGKYGI
jgi:hypothetical protein